MPAVRRSNLLDRPGINFSHFLVELAGAEQVAERGDRLQLVGLGGNQLLEFFRASAVRSSASRLRLRWISALRLRGELAGTRA